MTRETIGGAPTAQYRTVDWVILGASHAMPLDFADFNAQMERETRLRILNLAAPDAGPLYNRFVLEDFLRAHRARNLLYVVDSFAFYSRTWNEDRFADAKTGATHAVRSGHRSAPLRLHPAGGRGPSSRPRLRQRLLKDQQSGTLPARCVGRRRPVRAHLPALGQRR
jgi:hypothetical protein